MAAVSTPRIKVTLTKTMAREKGLSERFKDQNRVWDLTKWLGEGGVVRTSKTLHEPAGGFTIAFPDKPDYALADTLYGLIEPMDVVEIRMGRGSGDLPVIMRGFVVKVGRSETISQDGKPQRVVLIQGNDYGAVLHWRQILWNKEYMESLASKSGGVYLDVFKLHELLKIDKVAVATEAGEFVRTMVDVLCNGWLRDLAAATKDGAVLTMGIDIGISEGAISSMTTGAYQGDVWGFIASFGDLDWNECFIEDRKDKPWVIYRPKPWRKAYEPGQYIMPGAKDPGMASVDAVDLRASQLTHGSEQVANFYWVEMAYDLIDPMARQADTLRRGNAIHEVENTTSTLFGLRIRNAMTTQEAFIGAYPSEKEEGMRKDWSDANADWLNKRRQQLIDLHEDNVVFEEGAFTLKGNPDLKIGKYLRLVRGSFAGDYYMTSVDHTFSPFQDWVTQVRVERGTGFLNRMKEGRSPVWMEGRPGVYDRVAPTIASKDPVVIVEPVESAG